jgi:transposase
LGHCPRTMRSRDPRLFLAPDPDEEPIPVSPRKLAELLRRLGERDQLEHDLQEAREEIRRLREEKARSKEKSAALRSALDHVRNSLAILGTDSRTAAAVGVPSSRVFFRPSRPPHEPRRRSGGQPGHPGTTRPRPTPNAPPRVLPLKQCPKCEATLGDPSDSSSHAVTDLPAPRLEIFELVVPRYKCPGCGERVHAEIPEAYRGDFGPRLKALVAELRVLGMPFEKIAELLRMTYGLEVSVASLLAMEGGVAESLDRTYRELSEELRDATRTPHAEGDETSMPVNGELEWLWVGTSPTTTVYRIQEGRGGAEASSMWAGYRGTLTHDGLASYGSVDGVVHQMDLVHVNRWLQKVEASHGIRPRGLLKEEAPRFERAGRPPKEFLEFAEGIRSRLAAEVRWGEAHPEAIETERAKRYREAVASMRGFLARSWRDEDASRIAGQLTERLETLYTFVRVPGTSWNSNEAEREIRVAVVHRKLSGGRRTARGAWVLERLLTVWRTCAKRQIRFWQTVSEKLGAGPYPGPGPPSAGPVS